MLFDIPPLILCVCEREREKCALLHGEVEIATDFENESGKCHDLMLGVHLSDCSHCQWLCENVNVVECSGSKCDIVLSYCSSVKCKTIFKCY